jgi:hypothetical protein
MNCYAPMPLPPQTSRIRPCPTVVAPPARKTPLRPDVTTQSLSLAKRERRASRRTARRQPPDVAKMKTQCQEPVPLCLSEQAVLRGASFEAAAYRRRGATQSPREVPVPVLIFPWRQTLELSRHRFAAAARPQSYEALPTPRSGVGLNELLGAAHLFTGQITDYECCSMLVDPLVAATQQCSNLI